jgi:hypothetical protein
MQGSAGAIADRRDADLAGMSAGSDDVIVFAQVSLGIGEACCAGDGVLLDRW